MMSPRILAFMHVTQVPPVQRAQIGSCAAGAAFQPPGFELVRVCVRVRMMPGVVGRICGRTCETSLHSLLVVPGVLLLVQCWCGWLVLATNGA